MILCDRPIEVHHHETHIVHKLSLSNVRIAAPSTVEMSGRRRYVTANECVTRRLSYAIRVHATLTYEVHQGNKIKHQHVYLDREIDHIPCMKGCSVVQVMDDSGDARADPGGYFVIDGQECVIEGQEQLRLNEPSVAFQRKEPGVRLEFKSNHHRGRPSTLLMIMHTRIQGVCKPCDTGPISVQMPYMEALPLALLFRLVNVTKLPSMITLIVKDSDPSWFRDCVESALTYDAEAGFAPSLKSVVKRLAKDADNPIEAVEHMIRTKLFPQNELAFKQRLLARCARKLLRVTYGLEDEDDRDDYINRRIAYAATFFENIHRHYYHEWRKCTAGAMKRSKYLEEKGALPLGIEAFLKHGMAGSHLDKACRTGNFTIRHRGQFYGSDGLTQHVVRIEPCTIFTHINRLNNPVKRERPGVEPRLQHVSSFGIVDPIETPDSTMCGLTRTKCPWAGVRVGYTFQDLQPLVAPLLDDGFNTVVWINGIMAGYGDAHHVRHQLRQLRSTRDLPFDVALYVDDDGDMHVEGDAGSLWWPLVRVDTLAAFRRMCRRHPTIDGLWEACLNEGLIEAIHKSEERYHCCVAVTYETLDRDRHTHIVLHPSQIGSGRGPFANHNQAPRNTYFYNMLKACIGGRPRDHQAHFATTSYYLWSPERPLVTTFMDHVLTGGGHNTTTVTMIIMCTDGYTMEDSCAINQRSLDMGLFRSTTMRSVHTTVRTNDTECEQLMLPPEGCSQQLHNDYSRINPNTGLVDQGTPVTNGTVVASKVAIVTTRHHDEDDDTVGSKTVARDRSVVLKKHRNGEEATVDSVVQCKTLKGEQMVRVRTRANNTQPVRGDKFSCLPAWTKVLCHGQGFKRISEVTLDDKVACFDTTTGKIVYDYPSAIHVYNVSEYSRLWKYGWSGITATPNHRMCVAGGPPSNPIELVPADVLRKERDYIQHVHAATHGFNESEQHRFPVSIWAQDKQQSLEQALYNFGTECRAMHPCGDDTMHEFVKKLWPQRKTWLYTLTKLESEWILRGIMGALHDDVTTRRPMVLEDDMYCVLAAHAGFKVHIAYDQLEVDWSSSIIKKLSFKDVEPTHTIQGVYCLTVPTGAFVAQQDHHVFMTGNSRYGQKATCGRIVPCHDMPYNDATGIAADIALNPHGFPSRMTLAQLIGMLGGNVAAMTGDTVDGTPFEDLADADDESADAVFHALGNQLEACGLHPKGLAVYRDGVTGRAYDCKVFEGQIAMMKLKHMAIPKLCARTRGPNNPVTGQPVEGMTQNGGPRMGEMEKDNQIAHGAACTLSERFMVSSDGKWVPVCRECGQLAVPPRRRDNGEMGDGFCHDCVKYGTVEMVQMPCAFNLTMQELAALHVDVRLDTVI